MGNKMAHGDALTMSEEKREKEQPDQNDPATDQANRRQARKTCLHRHWQCLRRTGGGPAPNQVQCAFAQNVCHLFMIAEIESLVRRCSEEQSLLQIFRSEFFEPPLQESVRLCNSHLDFTSHGHRLS